MKQANTKAVQRFDLVDLTFCEIYFGLKVTVEVRYREHDNIERETR